MSDTTLYSIQPDGSLQFEASYKNSHGFAPLIWTMLTAKYVPMGMPVGGDSMLIMAGYKCWLTDTDHCFGTMGPASRNGLMSDSDALCYAVTLDFAAVAPEHFDLIADAFDKFLLDHKVLGHERHLAAMAAEIRELKGTDARGVCWNTTSLSDTFDQGFYDPGQDPMSEDVESREYNFDLDTRHIWIGPSYLRSEPQPA